ncbi:MAG: ABC transporter ATP-binding protein [Aerococcus sp.]|nr:ABC transporter ATP-binding protein [Aerococcus sp.]
MTPMITFNHVTKDFQGQEVLHPLELQIEPGEFFVLVGPSGSGKTTTLKMINGLIEPTDGNVYFKGKRIKDYQQNQMRWQMGYVLQQIALFPNLNVAENIALIPEMLHWPKEERKQRIDELLQQVNLDPEQYRNRRVSELSGGEQQRIGILRAIAAKPDVVLMDEPFSALDPLSRTQLQELVLKLHDTLKTTIVFVTHDMNEAVKLGDRIAVMNQGTLIQVDTPDNIQQHPKTEIVASMFAPLNHQRTVASFRHHVSPLPDKDTDYPMINTTASEQALYQLLSDHVAVVVQEDGHPLGLLTQAAVFQCLAERQR